MKSRPWLALLLLLALVPGVSEAVENAAHLAVAGHLAHASPAGDEHDAPGPEHGCSGTLHLCQCCVSPSFAPTHVVALAPQDVDRGAVTEIAHRFHGSSGPAIEHPPRA